MRNTVIILLFILVCFANEESYIDSSKIRNPSLAWKLSIIPGLGQMYNNSYLKALGFSSAQYFSIVRFSELKKDNRIGLRNTYAWWIFGLCVWNMMDAYVDAHLSTFPWKRIQSNHDIDSLIISNK